MRILQLVQKPQRRGAEVFAYQLSQWLRHAGHQIRIVYLYPFSESHGLPVGSQDRLLDGSEHHPLERLVGFHPGLLAGLRQAVREFDPDVVQVNGGRAVKYGALCRRLDRQDKWALIYRNIGQPGDWVRGSARLVFYRTLVMPHLDGVVGVSQATLQQVRDFYDLSIPMTAIPNAVDPSSLRPAREREAVRQNTETPDGSLVLLYVGSLAPEKRLDRLLRVARGVMDRVPQAHLWLVGDGPERLSLESQATDLGLAPRTRFLGVQADVASHLNAADLFVLTSDTEGVPAVILEAGLFGLPVVSTEVGGISECVRDGETGILVHPQDEGQFTEAVVHLLKSPEARERMGNHAQRWIRSQFTMDIVARSYVDFYHEAVGHVRA